MTRSYAGRRLRALGLAAVGILILASVLDAHDFWIVPNAFAIAEGGTIEVRGQNGTKFPTSTSAITPDRVADARIIGAAAEERITEVSVSDKSLLLRHKPTSAGQRVIAIALTERVTRTTPAGLQRYIALEGNSALAERYDRDGAYGRADSLTQRATKYAKTVVDVGRGGPRAFARAAGHALEFIPLADPSALRWGDSLQVRLVYRQQPLAAAHLHAGAASAGAGDTTTKDVALMTDALGRAKIPLDRAGLWNVRTLHAAPSATPGAWDVAFATLVFNVASRNGASGRASDSADVVAVVDAYQRALATADSARALALLAADAVILESGEMESRDEYRSEHLPADISYAKSTSRARTAFRVTIHGDAAWVASTQTTRGEFGGRRVNSTGAELMVLSREPEGWRIRAIHWSSRSRR